MMDLKEIQEEAKAVAKKAGHAAFDRFWEEQMKHIAPRDAEEVLKVRSELDYSSGQYFDVKSDLRTWAFVVEAVQKEVAFRRYRGEATAADSLRRWENRMSKIPFCPGIHQALWPHLSQHPPQPTV